MTPISDNISKDYRHLNYVFRGEDGSVAKATGADAGEEGEFDAGAGESQKWMKVEKFNPTFQSIK